MVCCQEIWYILSGLDIELEQSYAGIFYVPLAQNLIKFRHAPDKI